MTFHSDRTGKKPKRMAGDELDKDTSVAKEAKSSVLEAGEKGDVNKLEEQVMDKREIQAKMDSGMSADDIYAFTKEHGINYNKKGRAFMESQGDYKIGKGSDQWGDIGGDTGDTAPTPKPEVDRDPTPFPLPGIERPEDDQPYFPGPGTGGSGDQIVNQDNDINSNVTGDGNVVNIGQDNSVRQSQGSAQSSLGATNLMDAYVLNLRKKKTAI